MKKLVLIFALAPWMVCGAGTDMVGEANVKGVAGEANVASVANGASGARAERVTAAPAVTYDFSFAEAGVRYLETGDSTLLGEIAALDAAAHLARHNARFGYGAPQDSHLALVEYLFADEVSAEALPLIVRNMDYARRHVAEPDLAREVALEYLPAGFRFDGSRLFYTLGYDLGVAYGTNASLNLAHPHYLANPTEIKYYSIHELHHAGFMAVKGGEMPSLEIAARSEMARLVEYLTHLEGMAVYAALDIRTREGALDADGDYVALQDEVRMEEYVERFFEIYRHFADQPEVAVTDEDWALFGVFSRDRLAYRVGALIARTIDRRSGRSALTALIAQPGENFIAAYDKRLP